MELLSRTFGAVTYRTNFLAPVAALIIATMTILFIQADWEAIAKIWGPLGVICFLLVLAIWKGLIPYIKQQAELNRDTLMAVVEDARKERDYVRTLREKEVDRFLESSRVRDEAMKHALEGVTRAIRDIHDKK